MNQLNSARHDEWLAKSRSYGSGMQAHGPESRDVIRRPGTWVEFDRLGTLHPYSKTFSFDGEFASERHRLIAGSPTGRFGLDFLIDLGIDGYLRVADALKIYEIAYLAPGNVLELGTHQGLSTSIIASALEDRGNGRLETVDIDAGTNAVARANLLGRPGADRVTFTLKDATLRLDELISEGATFGFMFVDHWHGYEATHEAAERAIKLVAPGGFVLFHDFDDSGNSDPTHVHGVYQAVLDVYADRQDFVFHNMSGCVALFRRAADSTAPSGDRQAGASGTLA